MNSNNGSYANFKKIFILAAILTAIFISTQSSAAVNDKNFDRIKIKIAITAEAFNMDLKSREAIAKKTEGYIFGALLNHASAVLTSNSPDVELSINLKMAAVFSNDEAMNLWAISAVATTPAVNREMSDSRILLHELKCFQFGELKKHCEEISSVLGTHCVKVLKERKSIAERQALAEKKRIDEEAEKRRKENEIKKREEEAARNKQMAEMKRQEEEYQRAMKKQEEEYRRAMKKQEEENKALEIETWKAKKYQEWKKKAMSIQDEELERAGITLEELLNEFKKMEAKEKR